MIKLKMTGPNSAVVLIRGDVDPTADALEIPANLDRLEIYIDSFGGDALAGISLYDKIKEANAKEKVAKVSLAMSAATLPLCAVDKIIMGPASIVMIHGVGQVAQIKRQNAAEIISAVEKLDDVYAKTYATATKNKTTQADFLEIMLRDSFFDADDMKRMGFNVEIGETPETNLPTTIREYENAAANKNLENYRLYLLRKLGF